MSRISFILLAVVFVWLLQLCFSFMQIRRFNSRIIALRMRGKKTAVGMVGNTYKRRVYAVLVVDDAMNITAAEQFSGWTIFAHLKPVHFLVGKSIEDIGEAPQHGLARKTWDAFRNAAHYITEYDATHDEGAESSSGRTHVPTGWKVGGTIEAKSK